MKNLQDAAQGYGDAQRNFGAVGIAVRGSNGQVRDGDFVRANLAKQLDVTYGTAEKVLNAWRNGGEQRASELLGGTKLTADQLRPSG